MDRASWKAFIKLSLVSIPVQGYSAARPEREQITLHQLHQGHARIQYRKVCPVHGEVPNDEIVKGYEYSKGEYVVIDPEEIENAQEKGDRRSRFTPLFRHRRSIRSIIRARATI